MAWFGFVVLGLSLQIIASYGRECFDDLVKPCTCEFDQENVGRGNDDLNCGPNVDLKSTFKRIITKQIALSHGFAPYINRHFKKLVIKKSYVNKIESDTMDQLTFDYVAIEDCRHLRRINSLAFNKSASSMYRLKLSNLPKYLPLWRAPYNLFDLINSLKNITWIWIENINIYFIPFQAFQPLLSLKNLVIRDNNETKHRLLVADRAFYNLDNLESLELPNFKIDYFPKEAFKFRNDSNRLFLVLDDNNLNSFSFSSGWLNNINRPVDVSFRRNSIKFLDQSVFQPFLNDTRENVITNLRDNLDCSDCRNAWLAKNRYEYESKVRQANCGGGQLSTVFEKDFTNCFFDDIEYE